MLAHLPLESSKFSHPSLPLKNWTPPHRMDTYDDRAPITPHCFAKKIFLHPPTQCNAVGYKLDEYTGGAAIECGRNRTPAISMVPQKIFLLEIYRRP